MSKVKVKESVAKKNISVKIDSSPKYIMSCGKDKEVILEIRPKGCIIAYTDERIDISQARTIFENLLELTKDIKTKEVEFFHIMNYYDGDADDRFWK